MLVNHIPPGGNYKDVPDEFATGRITKYKESGGRTTTYGRLHPDEPAYTINTYFRRPNVGCNFHYADLRLITPREAMRFQSIPDYFSQDDIGANGCEDSTKMEPTVDSVNNLCGGQTLPLPSFGVSQLICWNKLSRPPPFPFIPHQIDRIPQRCVDL